jgi:hypothetical protein
MWVFLNKVFTNLFTLFGLLFMAFVLLSFVLGPIGFVLELNK